MDNVFESNVCETSVSEGVGPFTLTAMPGFKRFGDVLSVGKPCHYMIKATDNVGRPTGEHEFGVGTYTAANQLTRTTVVGSSNGGAAVNFLTGPKIVCFTALAPTSDALRFDWQEAIGMNFAGAVQFFGMTSAPAGWVKANGAALSRATYARLFGKIGTTFGAGDGSTTFNVPDLRGEFIRGWDDGRAIDSGRAFASAQSSQNLSHNHGINDPTHNHGITDPTHVHGVADPGHSHGIDQSPYDGGGNTTAVGNNPVHYANNASTRIGGTGIWLYASGTGITINGNPTGITIQAAGGAEARPRNVSLLACIKF